MKRKALAAIMAAAMAVSMAGCGGSTSESAESTKTTEKNRKNRSNGCISRRNCSKQRQTSVLVQPSAIQQFYRRNLDKEALNFNEDTYYVGFDANQGAELQGEMVLDYIKEKCRQDRQKR